MTLQLGCKFHGLSRWSFKRRACLRCEENAPKVVRLERTAEAMRAKYLTEGRGCRTRAKAIAARESAALGCDRGWLKGEWDDRDEQNTVWIGRLTKAGRKHFGLEVNNG